MAKTASLQHMDQAEQVAEAIKKDAFRRWYRKWEIRRAFREGDAWKETPASVKPAREHAPSGLLQCHRKTVYKTHNAPQEEPPPSGMFWVGTRIEEEIVQPFLEDIAASAGDPQIYVQNSIWVDYEIETEVGGLRFRGETDPVLCTPRGEPLLPTEVKAKQSLESVDRTDPEPAPHHRAQLHAYMRGLDGQVTHSIETGLVIYVDQTKHELVAMEVEFDQEFWDSQVVEWAASQTEYRLEDALPPAEPSFGWECSYCSFKERCGQGDGPYADLPVTGFVPLTEYPREHVETALDAEGGASMLTPTVAHQYPDLAEEYAVADWACSVCGETIAWEAVDWDGTVTAPPSCPVCARAGRFSELRGPRPEAGDGNE